MVLEEATSSKLLAINDALASAGFSFAFGGAIALAFCVRAPRATVDLDINVFVSPSAGAAVLDALPLAVSHDADDLELLERDGQVRLRWGETPVDLFLSTDPFHDDAASAVRQVPFVGHVIPVLSCSHLAVFKTFFARGKDFIDIGNMVEARSFDVPEVRTTLIGLLGDDAPQLMSFDHAVEEGRNASDDPMGGRFTRP